MIDSMVARRAVVLVVLVGACATTLAGCLVGDREPPSAELVNDRAASVTLTLTGSDVPPKEFPSRVGWPVYGPDGTSLEGAGTCEGDGFVVTDTITGDVLGTGDGPVCGDTTIVVDEDGTVTR